MIPGKFGQLVHSTGDRVQERTTKAGRRHGRITSWRWSGRRRMYFVTWDDGSSGMYSVTDITAEK